MNCSLDLFHIVVREANSDIDFHSHSGYELVYYVTGKGDTYIQNELYTYTAGQFTIIPPNCRHNEFRKLESQVMFFIFSYDNVPVILKSGLYHDYADQRILKLIKNMATELRGKSNYYDVKLRCRLMEIIVEIGRMSNASPSNKANEQLLYAKNYIEQYYHGKLDLAGLADTLGYSYDHFRHVFKEYTGYSPKQYVIRQRMDQAKQKLINSSDPITLVSMECGFSTLPQFCMMFKKNVGVSPIEYRQLYIVNDV